MLSCSDSSLKSGEQLFATATRADYWFVLEHPALFGEKALAESELPAAVREHLNSATAALPNGRVQLIKRDDQRSIDGLAFFVVVNHEEQPNLYEFRLDKAENLLDLDLVAIAQERLAYRSHDRSEPLFLVCTNGKRDPCCSRLGLPLFRALREEFGEAVWQAAHVGGHRFAPNLVALPSGANYGYVDPDAAEEIIAATRAGHVHLHNYRGRSCYAQHVQAAENYLRQELALTEQLQFRLAESQTLSETSWMLRFTDRVSGETYCIQLHREEAAVDVLKSCRESAPTPLHQYRLDHLQVFNPQ